MSFSTPAARTIAVGVLTLVTSLGVTGCGSDTSGTSSKDPSTDASAQKLDVSIKGDTITPTNKRIPVARTSRSRSRSPPTAPVSCTSTPPPRRRSRSTRARRPRSSPSRPPA